MGLSERLAEVLNGEEGHKVLTVEEARRYLTFFSERGMIRLYFRPNLSPIYPHHDPQRFIDFWWEQHGRDHVAFIGVEDKDGPRYLYVLHDDDSTTAFTIYICGQSRGNGVVSQALKTLGFKRRVGELQEGVPQRFVDEIMRRGWIKEVGGKRWAVEIL